MKYQIGQYKYKFTIPSEYYQQYYITDSNDNYLHSSGKWHSYCANEPEGTTGYYKDIESAVETFNKFLNHPKFNIMYYKNEFTNNSFLIQSKNNYRYYLYTDGQIHFGTNYDCKWGGYYATLDDAVASIERHDTEHSKRSFNLGDLTLEEMCCIYLAVGNTYGEASCKIFDKIGNILNIDSLDICFKDNYKDYKKVFDRIVTRVKRANNIQS